MNAFLDFGEDLEVMRTGIEDKFEQEESLAGLNNEESRDSTREALPSNWRTFG
jgi:hypothetical protein